MKYEEANQIIEEYFKKKKKLNLITVHNDHIKELDYKDITIEISIEKIYSVYHIGIDLCEINSKEHLIYVITEHIKGAILDWVLGDDTNE